MQKMIFQIGHLALFAAIVVLAASSAIRWSNEKTVASFTMLSGGALLVAGALFWQLESSFSIPFFVEKGAGLANSTDFFDTSARFLILVGFLIFSLGFGIASLSTRVAKR